MKKLCQLSFIPCSAGFALLVLRLWIGLSLFFNHGLPKIMNYSQYSTHFMDPLHIGVKASLILSIFAEAVCSALIVLGIATRLAALIVVINLGVAFIFIHHHAMSGPGSGELAYAYLGGFITLMLAGGGCWQVCKITNAPPAPASTAP